MKKLIVAACVAMAAVAVNAASITWGSSAMYLPNKDGSKSETKASTGMSGKAAAITMSLFVIDATTYANLLGDTAAETVANVVAAYKGETSTITGTTNAKASTTVSDPTDYAVGKTAYAAILFSTTANGKEQYLGNVGEYAFDAGDNVTIANMGTYLKGDLEGTDISGMWTSAVPEPTSGLLLLLGMAGLALRRKRA